MLERTKKKIQGVVRMNEKIDNLTDKTNYITFISVISAIAVLFLHTNGCFWNFSATEGYWKSANVIESVFYFGVPCFFMISGITLMDFFERYTLGEYFIKRVKKTVIPFVIWNLIALVSYIIIGEISIDEINLKYIYQGMTSSTIVSIYWFFNSLFVLYLSMPLFAAVEHRKRKLVYTYLVCVGGTLNIIIPFLKTVCNSDLNTPYTVTVVSGVLIWVPLGWLLHNCEMKKGTKYIIYILAVLGLVFHIFGTYYLSIEAGEIVNTYKGFQNAPCLMYSVGIFIFLKDVGTRIMSKDNVLSRGIKFIGKYTFAIYLMQFILLGLFSHLLHVDTKSIIYRLGAPFIMIPIIICITYFMRKIPILKHIVP
jgi:surface polysaccharide O-acyltransferase-like enzyme